MNGQQAAAQFFGSWKLISCERRSEDGIIDYRYGKNPVGRLTYDSAGRMSAQLMQVGRRSTLAPGVGFEAGNVSGEELREAADGYIAYFGAFHVDEASRIVTHHVKAALIPSWVGTDLKRTYRFESNRLILTAVSTGVSELTWEREPD